MSEMLELVCSNCQRVLRVPSNRAGQKGKCAYCHSPILIPVNEEEDFSSSSFANYDTPSDFASPMDGMYPTEPMESYEENMETMLDNDLGNAIPQITERREFSSFNQPTQHLASPPPSPQVTATSLPPQSAVNSPMLQIEEKPKNKGILSSVITLFVGVFIGLMVGPGYMEVIPGKDVFFPSKENTEKDIPSEIASTETKNPKEKITEEIIEDFSLPQEDTPTTTKPVDKPSTTASKFDLKTARRLKSVYSNLDSQLDRLGVVKGNLSRSIKVMQTKYRIYEPKGNDMIRQATKWEKSLRQRTILAKKSIRSRNNKEMYKAQQYLKQHKTWSKNLQQLTAAMDKKSHQLDQHAQQIKQQNVKVSVKEANQYIQSWYSKLAKETKKVEPTFKRRYSFSSTGASIKWERLKISIRKIHNYPTDIQNLLEIVEQSRKKKSIKTWLQERKKKAITFSQKEQIKLIEKFVRNKKFYIDVSGDTGKLETTTRNFLSDLKDKKISEGRVDPLLKTLQKIQRKYDENYQDLNSAVTNFQFWNP